MRLANTIFDGLQPAHVAVPRAGLHSEVIVSTANVTLVPAIRTDAPVLSNLLELYIHDLSGVFALELGEDGRFGYEKLPLYWSEPERRFPFLIRCDGRIAGFALATRGSPVTPNPDDFDLAEFFIVRRYRRTGVGRDAAFQLWNRSPVRWTVRVSEANIGGCQFWSNVIAEYTGQTPAPTSHPGRLHPWRVFAFDSASRASS